MTYDFVFNNSLESSDENLHFYLAIMADYCKEHNLSARYYVKEGKLHFLVSAL